MALKQKLSLWQWLCHFLPVFRWLPTYDWRANLLGDVIAALTVTAVAAPEAVSYAGIAGLPAEQGLNTGFLAPLAYAVAGASPQLIVGPTAIMCILTSNAIPGSWGGLAVGNGANMTDLRVRLAALLALFVAGIQMAIGLLRLGGVVSLISTPVVAGFTTGSALLTASSQFATLLGLPKCKGAGGGSCTFAEALAEIVDNWSSIKGAVTLMSLVCLSILLAVKYGPGLLHLSAPYKRLSNLAPLVLVAVTVPIVAAMGSKLESWGLTPPKPIPSGAPSPLLPFGPGSILAHGTPSDYAGLLTDAVPLALIGYMGAVTIAKTVARQDGPYATDSAQEIWGQVAANVACGIGQGLPVTGSFSRTAVNSASGARTGLASALTGGLMALALQTLTGVLSLVPDVARASIVMVAISKMVELSLIPALWRTDKRDCAVFIITVAVVIFVDAALGLLAGVACQWFISLTRASAHPSPLSIHVWAGGSCEGEGDRAGGAHMQALIDALDVEQACLRVCEGAGARVYIDVTAASVVEGRHGAGQEGGREEEGEGRWPVFPHSSSINGEIGLAPLVRRGVGRGSLLDTDSGEGGEGASTYAGAFHRLPSGHPAHCALTIRYGPDLQFANAERLSRTVEEACAVFHPAALLLDCTACACVDSTGAAALLTAAEDARRSGVGVIAVYGLPQPSLQVVRSTAACSGGAAAALHLQGFPPTIASSALCGSLLLLGSAAQAGAVGRIACARSMRGQLTLIAPACSPASQSVSSASGGAAAPLLDGDEGEGDGVERKAASVLKQRVPVQGVPLSPLPKARQEARRQRPVMSPAAAYAPVHAIGGQGVGGGLGARLQALKAGIRGGVDEMTAAMDDSRPMFVARDTS